MTPTACEIRDAVDRWRTQLWPKFMKERAFDQFFNGESLPCDGDAEPLPTLGLGRRFVKKPFGHLMSFFDDKPGPFTAEVFNPLEATRSLKVGRALKEESNVLLAEQYRSVLRSVAGRYLVTGRAFAYRTSKWDLNFRHGRLLTPIDAPDNVLSDEFWEWAFLGTMQLAEIDEILLGRRGKEGSKGWNREGLRKLKEWILESPPDPNQNTINRGDAATALDEPFSNRLSRHPLDVYYYFRKHEDRAGRYRKVSFYIVSRYNENVEIARRPNGYGVTERKLEITTKSKGPKDEERNQLLFSQEFAFDSVYECLIPFIGDSRVSGDQEMHQVKGEGELVFSRLLVMEHLTRAVVEGTSFGVQPNFSFANRSDANWARKIAEEGLSPWDEVPNGFKLLEKNNAFTGLNAATGLLNQLGFSVNQDGATGDLGNSMGGAQPTNFKAEAEQALGLIQQEVSQRNARWYSGCDLLFEQVGATLMRRPTLWRNHDPGYHDAQFFHARMADRGVMPNEYEPTRAKLVARRVGDKQAALQKAAAIMNNPNASIEARKWAEKQFIAAAYDDATAEALYPETPEQPDMDQAQSAILQNSAALTSLIALQPLPGDDPAVHLEQYHRPALVQRIQLLQQQGQMTPLDMAGIQALVQHMAQDCQRLPMDVGQIYMQELQGVMQLLQKQIPLNAKGSELDLAKRDADRKDAESQAKIAQTQSLIQNREQAAQHKASTTQFDQQFRLAQLANQEMETQLHAQKQQEESALSAISQPVTP